MEGRATRAPRTSSERAIAAPLLEVFSSLQGEGRYAGEPQVFLRLAGCPLRCRWCDTPGSWALRGQDRVDWATPFQAATRISAAESGAERTVSVTGGEPLLWPEFLAELPTFLGPRRIHLETAGAHPRLLASVLHAMDHVSLDLKLPADMEPPVPVSADAGRLSRGLAEPVPTSAAEWAEARAACLELVAGVDACGKLVLAGDRRVRDYESILDDVASIAPALPLYIQPVTPMHGVPAPDRSLLLELVELALDRSLEVRVIPQIHRMLRIP